MSESNHHYFSHIATIRINLPGSPPFVELNGGDQDDLLSPAIPMREGSRTIRLQPFLA
jgi:hypothetical protein